MGDFWLQKMRTYFTRIDFDEDGKITRKDFEGMAKRFSETGKLNAARSKDLMDTLTAVWDLHLSSLSAPGGMSREKFIEAMRISKDTKKLKATLQGPLPLFFHAVDSNDDGYIDEAEYAEFFRILNLDEKNAPGAFRAIDTDHDGRLSLEEFVNAGTTFFLGENKCCPTQGFWGPLVA